MSHDVEILFPRRLRGEDFGQVLNACQQRARAPRCADYRARVSALAALSDAMLGGQLHLQTVPGFAFLAGFLRASNLEQVLARELANPDALRQFVPLGNRKSLRLQPKGVVCHWIAGNVPLLGMFSWVLSALAGNVNVLRLSTKQQDVISPLLDELSKVSDAGRQLADETLVVIFDHANDAAHRRLSLLADVRLAWGGQEAVDAIRRLPCRWDCEDITLGPRSSYAVVDPEFAGERIVSRLVADIITFDQQACSSPQYVFVKGRRHEHAFERFVEQFSALFARQAGATSRHALDFAETYQIHLDRTRILLDGGALERDAQTQWTVATMDRPNDHVICANRFVQIVPFEQLASVYAYLPRSTQTVVILLSESDMLDFTEGASRLGVCRFPRPGEGNHFEIPWDGIPLLSRLTRWVVRSEAP